MASVKNTLAAVLACTMLLANTVCACVTPNPTESETNPHAHHQSAEQSAADTALCAHEACENCEFLDVAATPERDGKLTGPKPDLDDDVIWIAAVADVQPAPSAAARASPLIHSPPGIAQTPVRLADLLLE